MRLHTDALIAYFQRVVQSGEDTDIAKSYLQTLHDISHFVDVKSRRVLGLPSRRDAGLSRETLLQFGKLLKDRAWQARLSRAALGKDRSFGSDHQVHRDGPDSTHALGRLPRLMAVDALQLTWGRSGDPA